MLLVPKLCLVISRKRGSYSFYKSHVSTLDSGQLKVRKTFSEGVDYSMRRD